MLTRMSHSLIGSSHTVCTPRSDATSTFKCSPCQPPADAASPQWSKEKCHRPAQAAHTASENTGTLKGNTLLHRLLLGVDKMFVNFVPVTNCPETTVTLFSGFRQG